MWHSPSHLQVMRSYEILNTCRKMMDDKVKNMEHEVEVEGSYGDIEMKWKIIEYKMEELEE